MTTGRVHVREAATGEVMRTLTRPRQLGGRRGVQPDGSLLVSAEGDKTMRAWG
jgi:hypothetical protein